MAIVFGTNGNDSLNFLTRPAILDAAPDFISGLNGNDIITALSTNDTLNGGAGNDILNGGAGNDSLIGGPGRDTLNGGAGNDIIRSDGDGGTYRGDAGNDTMFSGLGNETMDGGVGVDLIDHTAFGGNYVFNMATGLTNFGGESYINFENATMGAGNDRVTGNASANVINGGAGNDTLDGGTGNDVLNGGVGSDSLIGGAGNDILNGGAGTDSLIGGAGNDILNGGAGNDSLIGGAGNDILTGGGDGQIDVLTSGSLFDRDTFVLGTAGTFGSILYDSAGNADFARITDFDLGDFIGEPANEVDRIQLRGAASGYRLANGINVGGFVGVGIFDRNATIATGDDDLIGLVQGVTAGNLLGQLNLTNTTQFVYVV